MFASDVCEGLGVVEWLSSVLETAIREKATDIHFEPHDRRLVVRFRKYGVLEERICIARARGGSVLRIIKLLANMDITTQYHVQEGRFEINCDGVVANFRVAIMPTPNGESAVVRVLDNRVLVETIEICLQDVANKKLFKDIESCGGGLVLVCGPTGSGKTSWLYALLSSLMSANLKIITIEDPVEYAVNGITQVQCDYKRGIGFAEILKRVLRHDPDVIMVGEIRDSVTVQLAVQAALTGHLVLATVHAGEAVMAVARLMDLGVERYLIAAVCRYIIAQRLVVCKNLERKSIREVLEIDELLAGMVHLGASVEELRQYAISRGMLTLRGQAESLLWEGVIDLKTFRGLGFLWG